MNMTYSYSEKEDYAVLKGQKKDIKDKESKRKQKPSKCDYTKLYSLLKDFGINIRLKDIPEFDNYKDMEIWKTQQIDAFLNDYNKYQEHIDNNLNKHSNTYKSHSFFAKTKKPKENRDIIDWSEFHF